jgi:hypothetical protein
LILHVEEFAVEKDLLFFFLYSGLKKEEDILSLFETVDFLKNWKNNCCLGWAIFKQMFDVNDLKFRNQLYVINEVRVNEIVFTICHLPPIKSWFNLV